jgi:glycosyltransferase involved in cell wall biosynthesis
LGALRAYKEAFPDVGDNVGLVLKVNGADGQHPFSRALAEEVAGREDIFVINRVMSRVELDSLISLCDCFVSLHRSEGFGFGPAEAMYLGKPVIATNWSGNTDYMTGDNSIGINYQLVKLGRQYGPYEAHQYWAEPDIGQAAYWMARISRDRDLAEKIGRRGQATIMSEYSPEAVGEIIRRRLEYVRRRS